MSDLTLALKPIPALNPRFMMVLASLAILAAAAAQAIVAQLLASFSVWLLYALALVVGATAIAVINLTRGRDRCVSLLGERLVVPVPRGLGRRALTVDVSSLRSIELTHGFGARLRLNVPGRFPVVVRACDVARGDLAELHRQLLATAAGANTELTTALRLFGHRHRIPVATIAICLVLVTAFLVSRTAGDNPVHHAIVIGGMNDWLVSHGEVYRLGAAVLLHGGWPHLIVNATLLMVLGLRLEYVTGPTRLAGAFATGALSGNIAAWVAGGQTVVVGASGGVFALLALYGHTLWIHRRHLPTRTQFASNIYLSGALGTLFIPLPGYAVSAHLGGFVGGALWSLGFQGGRWPQRASVALGAGAWAFLLSSGWYGLHHAGEWNTREPAVIEQMARDPDAGTGTLALVGWYALRHHLPDLAAEATQRLTATATHTSDSASTLAELLLDRGDPAAAARYANLARELRDDDDNRNLLVKAELAAYAESCAPAVYTGGPAPQPRPVVSGHTLRFSSTRPLYVHAAVDASYVMMKTGLPLRLPDARDARVIVLGYTDTLPWLRKPRVLRLSTSVDPSSCSRPGEVRP